MTGQREIEIEEDKEEGAKKEKEKDRGRAVEPGLAPLRSFFSLAQRLTGIFCRPNRRDVKIALMADQREKPCSNRYLSFPGFPCVPPPSSPLIDIGVSPENVNDVAVS